jgi:hypothetical protein
LHFTFCFFHFAFCPLPFTFCLLHWLRLCRDRNETGPRRISLRPRGYFVTLWGNNEMTFSCNESIGWWPSEHIEPGSRPLTLSLSLSSPRPNYCANNHLLEKMGAKGSTTQIVRSMPQSAISCRQLPAHIRPPDYDKDSPTPSALRLRRLAPPRQSRDSYCGSHWSHRSHSSYSVPFAEAPFHFVSLVPGKLRVQRNDPPPSPRRRRCTPPLPARPACKAV